MLCSLSSSSSLLTPAYLSRTEPTVLRFSFLRKRSRSVFWPQSDLVFLKLMCRKGFTMSDEITSD